MADFDQQRLIAILENPSETPSIECKGWLDLSDKRNKATLAKAAIALANHGGGTIVLGVGKKKTQGGTLACLSKPADFQEYSSDDIDSAINTYADPSLDFVLENVMRPGSGVEYPIILIPGSMPQPVLAKKGYEDVVRKNACYIRKPGPKSEEPSSPGEWRDLLNRCVLANRESMLDGIRGILDGQSVAIPAKPTDDDLHAKFVKESRARRHELLETFPPDDPAHLQSGHYETAISILGFERELSLHQLRESMRQASTMSSSVWLLFTDNYGRANPAGTAIETFYKIPSERRHDRQAHYFWRALNEGKLYLIRGFQEDEYGRQNWFHYTVPIWRIGQTLQYASNFCRIFENDLKFLFSTRYAGLNGRQLSTGSIDRDRWLGLDFDKFVCLNPNLTLRTVELSPQQVSDNLVEILLDLLHPLYQQFSYFNLSRDFVANEVREMRKQGTWNS